MRRLRFGVLLLLIVLLPAPGMAGYHLRWTRELSGGCDFRVGWYVTVIGDRLFGGGPWDQFDCGHTGYGLLVFDLATGTIEHELLGTYAAAMAGEHLVLGHIDGVQVVDPETFEIQHAFVGPNPDAPDLALQGIVDGDVLAIGMGDTPESDGVQVVYRLALESGAVVQRYRVPLPADRPQIVRAAAAGDVVAVGTFGEIWDDIHSSIAGVFVFGADDGELRWSEGIPSGGHGDRAGRPIAVGEGYVVVGVPSVSGARRRGQVRLYDVDSGTLLHVIESPEDHGGFDQFGRAVALADGLLAIGAAGMGDWQLPGRAFVYDVNDWRFVGPLAAYSDNAAMGDSVAIGGNVIAVGGNYYDGVIHVFERDEAPSTTTTTSLAPPLPTTTTSVPASTTTTTTTTTTTPISTTTTTVPRCAGGCDDGDACTLDACIDGTCTATPLPGLETPRCRLLQLRSETACAPARVARWADARVGEMLDLLDDIERGGGGAPARRLQRRFARRARRYCRRVDRMRVRERVPSSCAIALSAGCRVGAAALTSG